MRDRRAVWIAGVVVALGLAGIIPALAQGNPGGSGAPPNAYGLCTAAANGHKNGVPWQSSAPPPFESLHSSYLESAASESNSDTESVRSDIVQDCSDAGIVVGGNPSTSSK
jgi:hypothetical protein